MIGMKATNVDIEQTQGCALAGGIAPGVPAANDALADLPAGDADDMRTARALLRILAIGFGFWTLVGMAVWFLVS